MTTNTTLLLIVLIFAIVILVAIWWRRGKAKIQTPFGGMEIDATPPAPPASLRPGSATIDQADAGDNMTAATKTGGDARISHAKAQGDINATTENPSENLREKPAPKARPPR